MQYTQGIASDKYYMKEGQYKDNMFCCYEPQDMNGAVVVEKEGNGMAKQPETDMKVQYNIRERFGLCVKEDYAKESYPTVTGK